VIHFLNGIPFFSFSYDEGDEIHVVNTSEEDEIKQLSQKPDLYDILSRSLGKSYCHDKTNMKQVIGILKYLISLVNIAPSIYELDDVKKGILLQLFGGTNKTFTKSGSPRYRYCTTRSPNHKRRLIVLTRSLRAMS